MAAGKTIAKLAKWALVVTAGTLLVATVAGYLLGRAILLDRLAAYETPSGLRFRIEAAEGPLAGPLHLKGVAVLDREGVFLTAPEIIVDWSLRALLDRRILLHDVTAAEMRVLRRPVLKPVPDDPNAPFLPDIDLAIEHLEIGRLELAAPVVGKRHLIAFDGDARLAAGRIRLRADATAEGADTLHLLLDAAPDEKRLALDARLKAPVGGIVDGLTGLGRPAAFTVAGKGDWAHWAGRATATLDGKPVADLALQAENGDFRARGPLAGDLNLDATADFKGRRAGTALRLVGPAYAGTANGVVDFGAGGFDGVRIEARMIDPSLIPGIAVRGLRVEGTLAGRFAAPDFDYRLAAGSLKVGALEARGLKAEGKATRRDGAIGIPVRGTAATVTGLGAARVSGHVRIAAGRLDLTDLRLNSLSLDASGRLTGRFATGIYDATARATYRDLPGIGRVDASATARIKGAAVAGKATVKAAKASNGVLARLFDGPATMTSAYAYDGKKGLTLSGLRLDAPGLKATGGSGRYDPQTGAIRFAADLASRDYGPATLTAEGGLARPHLVLVAAKPGAGIGLKALTASLTGGPAGYEITVDGSSDYGPLAAALQLDDRRLEVKKLTAVGLDATGTLDRTPAGPLTGDLAFKGDGLTGTARFADGGAVQDIALEMKAANAVLPGDTPVIIGSGLARAKMRFAESGPVIDGSLALKDLRRGILRLDSARATYKAGAGPGRVAFVLDGQRGVPLHLAGQAELSDARTLLNLTGSAGRADFRLERPAVITRDQGDHILAPVSIILPGGRADLSGRYGERSELHIRLDGADLAVTRAFASKLGLGGKATGTVDLVARPGALPEGKLRLDVAGFTRTGTEAVSTPVDIALLGRLGAGSGDVSALFRQGKATVGRVKLRLDPIAPLPDWREALRDAPLSGGVRYNGPAELLWTLTGIAGQRIAGPVAFGADFSGTPRAPGITGIVRSKELRYENHRTGTIVTDVTIDGRFSASELKILSMTGKAGQGTVSAAGTIGLDQASGYPLDVKASLDHARLARSDKLGVSVSGALAMTGSATKGGRIEGELKLHEANYALNRDVESQVGDLAGVRHKGAPPPAPDSGPSPGKWRLDVRILADNQIHVTGMGLESEWRTDMRIRGNAGAPNVTGRLEVVRGTYDFAGRQLTLDDTSVIRFNGPLFEPELNISASTSIEGVSAIIRITGTASRPQFSFTSTPALPQDEVLARLMFGAGLSSLNAVQAVQLAAALNSLRGGDINPVGKLRSVTGLDRLRVIGADEAKGRGAAVAAGKYLTRNIYVEVISDTQGFTETQITIALSRAFSILSQAGGIDGPGITLRYSKQY